jgi:hypothetical protein
MCVQAGHETATYEAKQRRQGLRNRLVRGDLQECHLAPFPWDCIDVNEC